MTKRHQTQWAAQFAVASELCKRGYEVGFTMGNSTPLADLMVVSPLQKISFLVDVKGQATKNYWIVKRKELRPDLYFVLCFVSLAANRYFILSHSQVNELLEIYESKESYDQRFSGMNWTAPMKYENKWELLPQ